MTVPDQEDSDPMKILGTQERETVEKRDPLADRNEIDFTGDKRNTRGI